MQRWQLHKMNGLFKQRLFRQNASLLTLLLLLILFTLHRLYAASAEADEWQHRASAMQAGTAAVQQAKEQYANIAADEAAAVRQTEFLTGFYLTGSPAGMLLAKAEAAGVSLLAMEPKPAAAGFAVYQLSLSGEYEMLLQFVRTLENSRPLMQIEQLTMTATPTASEHSLTAQLTLGILQPAVQPKAAAENSAAE